MQGANGEGAAAGRPSSVDVGALIAELEAEILKGARYREDGALSLRSSARGLADRVARVSADRPLGGRGGALGALQKPVKLVVRKLSRWYVEPVFADQRLFNEAALRLIDDLSERVERLEAELRARDGEPPAGAG